MIYVGAPYTHKDPLIVEMRMKKFASVMSSLIEDGHYPVSPLMNHFLKDIVATNFPLTWTFWRNYSIELLNKCSSMHVVMTDVEWSTSEGLLSEITYAKEVMHMPITYIDKVDA